MLIICGLHAAAAEKGREWKIGQVVETDQSTASLRTIASADRNYLVRGTIGSAEQSLTTGATLRFAVDGKTMFVSIGDKEYRLYIVGERVAAAPGVAAVPSVTAVKPLTGPEKPEAGESLDNDAVVKMIVGGLKEDTVVRVIETRPGNYTLSKGGLAALKAAGVPPSVIAAMSAKMNAQH